MRSLHIRSVAIAATALLTLAGSVVAQEKPAGLLNSLEVRQLVARAEPADNARLAAHFTALENRSEAEAKRHLGMSQSFVGNPSRNLGTGMSAHCKRLMDLNTQSATTLRELAEYHDALAGGTPAAPPQGGARYQNGAGAPAPTDKDLTALAARASTPADHHALEEYFVTLAARYAADVKAHSAFAGAVRNTRIEHAAAIHDRLAALARDAAKEARAAAEMHKQFASIGR